MQSTVVFRKLIVTTLWTESWCGARSLFNWQVRSSRSMVLNIFFAHGHTHPHALFLPENSYGTLVKNKAINWTQMMLRFCKTKPTYLLDCVRPKILPWTSREFMDPTLRTTDLVVCVLQSTGIIFHCDHVMQVSFLPVKRSKRQFLLSCVSTGLTVIA